MLRRWQQYWECFLTLNIFNDCFKYHSSEHDLKTNKTETHSKIVCKTKVTHPIEIFHAFFDESTGCPRKNALINFWTRDHALHLLADIVVLQAVVNAGAVIARCPIS